MGYTRYWNRTNEPVTKEFCDEVNKILRDCAHKGIAIRGPYGEGKPIVTLNRVAFNGNTKGEQDLSHETLHIGYETGFNFCKTARKPYDYAVRRVLSVAKKYGLVTNVRSDGPNNKIYSDEEYIQGLVEW